MQAPAQDTITLPLHNWEALHQLEQERNYLSNVAAEIDVVNIASGASLGSPGFLLLAQESAYNYIHPFQRRVGNCLQRGKRNAVRKTRQERFKRLATVPSS